MANINNCHIINQSKGKHPSLPFGSIKNYILGEDYELEILFAKELFQKKLNKTYRHLDNTTNILSFPLSKESGLITFDLKKIKKEHPLYNLSFHQFLKLLFIHGCLHLKGFEHSSKMEKEEDKIIKIFS